MEKELERCEKAAALIQAETKHQDAESLIQRVENLQEDVGFRAFSLITSSPEFSLGMLRQWGQKWAAIVDDALKREPTQEDSQQLAEFEHIRQALGDEKERTAALEMQAEAQSALSEQQARKMAAVEAQLADVKSLLETSHAREERLKACLDAANRESQRTLHESQQQLSACHTLFGAVVGAADTSDWVSLQQELGADALQIAAGDGSDCWTWLPSWGAAVSEAHSTTVHGTCVQLYFALCHGQAPPSLASTVASGLARTSEMHLGLCRALFAKIVSLDVVEHDAVPLDQLLPLIQIIDTIAKRLPSVVDIAAVKEFQRRVVPGICANERTLLQKLVGGWSGKLWDAVPMCAPVLAADDAQAAVLVESLGKFLFINPTTKELFWIAADTVNWSQRVGITELQFNGPERAIILDLHKNAHLMLAVVALQSAD